MIFGKVKVQFRIQFWIRIHKLKFDIQSCEKFRILVDPDPQHWQLDPDKATKIILLRNTAHLIS
jgi:hypothetical protein